MLSEEFTLREFLSELAAFLIALLLMASPVILALGIAIIIVRCT